MSYGNPEWRPVLDVPLLTGREWKQLLPEPTRIAIDIVEQHYWGGLGRAMALGLDEGSPPEEVERQMDALTEALQSGNPYAGPFEKR
jgi:hypothetical protein